MRVLLLTNEYPPHVYGGAGVHVEFLSRELARLPDTRVDVRCFGDQDLDEPSLRVRGYPEPPAAVAASPFLRPVLGAFGRNLAAVAEASDCDVVHCHTWYSHFGGVLAHQGLGTPLVITVHSLEPLRPWKREQLGGGYDLSSWIERTALSMASAVIAVSEGTRDDVLRLFPEVRPERVRVIHNGIDPDLYRRVSTTSTLEQYGIDPARPFVLFVGRVTRQKGIVHLVRALDQLDSNAQAVLCAGAPDTPEIGAEMEAEVQRLQTRRSGVIWVRDMLPRTELVELYSHAAVFCCPSVYEPFGIINLEAMACGTPVVASRVGGIPEVVVDGQTGLLVPLEQQVESPFEPRDPGAFSAALAAALNRLLRDADLRARMGEAGRRRVEERFTWTAVARQVRSLYADLLSPKEAPPSPRGAG